MPKLHEILKMYASAALEICGLPVRQIVLGEIETMDRGTALMLANQLRPVADAGLTAKAKLFSRGEIYKFTTSEVCRELVRASKFFGGGTEDIFLADRIEPWYELFRLIQHNRMNVTYYWPECTV